MQQVAFPGLLLDAVRFAVHQAVACCYQRQSHVPQLACFRLSAFKCHNNNKPVYICVYLYKCKHKYKSAYRHGTLSICGDSANVHVAVLFCRKSVGACKTVIRQYVICACMTCWTLGIHRLKTCWHVFGKERHLVVQLEQTCCASAVTNLSKPDSARVKALDGYLLDMKQVQAVMLAVNCVVWNNNCLFCSCRWGHVLAEGAFGKGHGSRALLHALRHSFVMHDASYMCPVELRGPLDAVSAVLQYVRFVRLQLWHLMIQVHPVVPEDLFHVLCSAVT